MSPGTFLSNRDLVLFPACHAAAPHGAAAPHCTAAPHGAATPHRRRAPHGGRTPHRGSCARELIRTPHRRTSPHRGITPDRGGIRAQVNIARTRVVVCN